MNFHEAEKKAAMQSTLPDPQSTSSAPRTRRAPSACRPAAVRRTLADLRRLLSPLLAIAIMVGMLPQAQPASAAEIDHGPGIIFLEYENAAYSIGSVIKADGTTAQDTECGGDGDSDLFTIESDVWIVPVGALTLPPAIAGDRYPLEGVGVKTAILNTATQVFFFNEPLVGITKNLNAGTFNLIMDHCQDGQFDYGRDYIHKGTITVVQNPTPSNSQLLLSNQLKDSFNARSGECKTNARLVGYSGTLVTAALGIAAALPGTSAMAFAIAGIGSSAFFGLLYTRYDNCFRHYQELANDPPDPQYQQPTIIEPIIQPELLPADPFEAASLQLSVAVENEAVVAETLLHSIERFQGAQEKGRVDWQLIHARAARNQINLLQAEIARTNTAAAQTAEVLQQDARAWDSVAANLNSVRARVLSDGLTADDRRDLLNLGMTNDQVAEFPEALRDVSVSPSKAEMLTQLSKFQASGTSLIARLTEWLPVVEAAITELESNDLVGDSAPITKAGGPYTGREGTPLTLDGSASTSPAVITAYEWDLDADGAFDDAKGPKPRFTPQRALESTIGLRVTNIYGLSTVDYALISVADTNRAPMFTSTTPAPAAAIDATVGRTQPFAVTVTDPDGEPVAVTWTLDGAEAGTGLQYSYTPTADKLGPRVVTAIAANPGSTEDQISHRWIFAARMPDADGDDWRKNVDCDDSDASVNPGKTEVLRNGKDDDCDPGTSDMGVVPTAAFTTAKGLNRAQLEDGASIVGFSSVYNPQATFRAENAIDGSIETVWQTASGQPANQQITIDLIGTAPQVISQIVLRGGGAETDVKNFRVLVSTTGTANTDFTEVFSGTQPRDIKTYTFNFAPVAARYVRFVVVDNYGGSHSVVHDVDIRTRSHEGGIVSLREGPAARITAFSSQDGTNYPAEALIDDLPHTVWLSQYGQSPANQWVKVELGGGKTYTINRVRLQGSGHWDEVKDFEIRVSTTTTDDAAFTRVFSGTRLSNDQLQEFSFAPVAAKYVQLFVKSNYGRSDYLRLATFEAITTEGINAARKAGVGAVVLATSSPAAWATAPEFAIDYNPAGSWASTGQPTNQWLKLALLPNGPHIIDRVKLQTDGDTNAAKDFEIRVSNATAADADFSTTVLTGTLTKDKQPHWFTFPPVAAKFVQVYLRNNYGNTTSIQLSNVQVYSPNMGGPTVAFDDQSIAPDSTLTAWQWAFGDGAISNERHPVHTYAAPGTYTVSLTVTADDGQRATTLMPYTVLRSPSIDAFTWSPTQLKEDSSTVTFDATASSTDAGIVDYRWQFPFEAAEKTGQRPTSSFADSGDQPVTLTVIDSQLLQRKLTKTMVVENLPPTVNAGPDKNLVWGQAWNTNIWKETVTQSMEVSDPSSFDRATLNCTWDFGNSQTKSIQPCTSDSSRVIHTYATPGTYTAKLTATDKDGASANDSLIVNVDRRRMSILLPRDQIQVSNNTASIVATVVDEFDRQASLVGKSIQWSSGAETKTVVIGTGNKLSLQLALPAVSNPTITAEFAGDNLYHPVRIGRALGETAGVRDSQGTDFWLMFNTNFNNLSQELSLFVTGAKNTVGTVQIPGLGFTRSFAVTAGQVTTIPIPPSAASNNNIEAKAIHLESLDEVSVYGLNRIKYTTDAFMGLPVDALGTEYLVLGYNGWGSELGIVATENDTIVSLSFPQAPNRAPFTVKLNQGQMYQFNDLPEVSGTSITSNKPVSVFGGHACTQVPINVPACDHVIEQIPPVETWGREFVTVPLATRKNGDTFRFLASRDGTTVSVNGSVVATLKRGEVHERILNGSARIVANEPILVAQYSNGQNYDGVIADPFMMLIPPYEQFQRSYTVTTPAIGFRANYINVVAPQSAIGGIKLDGVLIDATKFTQISNSSLYGAQVPLSSGSHNLSASVPFGIFMYGFDEFDSYGYPGGASQAPVASVAHVTLTPEAASKAVGVQHCVTATVTDAQGQGLEDVRVDFRVTGSNAGTGFITTNTAGEAQYCYTGANVGTDSIVASVSASSATASVTWLAANTPPVAAEQTLVTSEDTALSITLTASDAQNNTLTYTLVTQPQHGTLRGTSPNLTYTPASNYIGPDSFSFKANDGTLDSNTATVSLMITPVNDAPLADAGQDRTVTVTTPVQLDGSASSDVEGTALTFSWQQTGGPRVALAGATTAKPSFTPTSVGSYAFTLTVSDGSLSATDTVVVTVAAAPNSAPVAQNQQLTINEDTATTITLAATDADNDQLTYAILTNPSHGALTLQDGTLRYTPASNYSGVDSFSFKANDGTLDSNTATVSITIAPVNDAPAADAKGPYTVLEGGAILVEATGSDVEGAALTYAWDLDGDGAYETTGQSATFNAADLDGPISRTVAVRVTDAGGMSTTDQATINVVNMAPTADLNPVEPVAEGSAATISFSGPVDPSGPDLAAGLRYAFACDGGALTSATYATSSAAATASCVFPEGPASTTVRARVLDNDGGYTEYTATVTVTNVAPTAVFEVPAAVDEGDSFSLALLNPSDPSAIDKAAGFTYAFDCGNDTGMGTFSTSNRVTCTVDASGSHTVRGQVRDKDGGITLYTATMVANSVPPSVHAPTITPGSSDEGAAVVVSAAFSSRVTTGESFTCRVNYGDNSPMVTGVVSGMTCTAPEHRYVDNGAYTVSVLVTNRAGATGASSVVHTVNNLAPVVGTIAAPVDPVAVKITVNVQASFSDAGVKDTHTAVWEWGDGSSSAATVSETAGVGSTAASHIYTAAGVHRITLRVTDKDGGIGVAVSNYVVVYDPDAGFVAGGGTINSPEGAYPLDPSLTGRASFGFVSKYQKGATKPSGQTEFQFRVADLNFHSETYEWLVVSGSRAQYKGTGTINGGGQYGFLLMAVDGQQTGGGGVDKFRIKIWDKLSGNIMYDNQLGDADDAALTTTLTTGSIMIHTSR